LGQLDSLDSSEHRENSRLGVGTLRAQAVTRMLTSPSMIASGALVTLEEWAALDEDDSSELVDGMLEEAEMTSVTHEVVVAWLLSLLVPYFRARGGVALGSGVKLAISPRRGRMGDIVCFDRGQRLPARGVVQVPPYVVVEVISEGGHNQRRDRVAKVTDYAAFGVRYYWLIDPEVRSLEILELGADGRYVHALGASEGKVTSVPGCPDCVLDLDDLWAGIDALSTG